MKEIDEILLIIYWLIWDSLKKKLTFSLHFLLSIIAHILLDQFHDFGLKKTDTKKIPLIWVFKKAEKSINRNVCRKTNFYEMFHLVSAKVYKIHKMTRFVYEKNKVKWNQIFFCETAELLIVISESYLLQASFISCASILQQQSGAC